MSRRKSTIIFVGLIHLVLIALVCFVPNLFNRMNPVKLPPDAMFVSLVSPESAVSDVPPMEVTRPEPPPEPEPEALPIPKKKKKKIEISKKRIVRDQAPNPQKNLTPEEIRKQLQLQNRAAASPAVKAPLPAWYYASVREIMYGAWVQPASLTAASGHQVRVQLTVARDGRITAKRILHRSGHPDMDESVNAALSAVGRLKALPAQYSGPDVDITITFELNRG
jgi:TonB family protein